MGDEEFSGDVVLRLALDLSSFVVFGNVAGK